jgi:hypothetical protein
MQIESACGDCTTSVFDGGCAVQPGTGWLVSLALVIAILIRARRGQRAGP